MNRNAAPRRIMVMGSPGSGKSTTARTIAATLGLPLFHLDRLYHRPGWTPPPPSVFAAEVARIAAHPAWVIDGNYASTAGPRVAAADLIVYLDVPRWLAMTRILWRIAIGYGRQRPDSADGCRERFDPAFLHYAWTWRRAGEPSVRDVIDGFAGRTVILHDRHDTRRLLATL